MKWSVWVCAVGLTGCLTAERRADARDRDADGFPSWELGGADCDDGSAAINPDADELCGNGLDDNCNGLVDEGGTGETTWYVDADGDGAPGSTPSTGCEMPPGAFAGLDGIADCDDSDPARSPLLEEVWYDGIDQDCDGNDTDQDADGYANGVDCDDADEAVNPDSLELCNNGLDDNCDGVANQCGPDFTRPTDDVHSRLPVAAEFVRLVDVNDDGLSDVVTVADDVARAYFAPVRASMAAGDYDLQLTIPSSRADAIDFADFNGDGVLDWVVDDSANGRVAVWMSPDPANGPMDTSELPSLIQLGDASGSGFGFGNMLRVIERPGNAAGPSLLVADRTSGGSESGDATVAGIRYYNGPWSSLPRDATQPEAELTGVEIETLGWPHLLLVDQYVPVVGEVGSVTGVFPLRLPTDAVNSTMVLGPAWFDVFELFGLSPDTNTIGRVDFPSSWDPVRPPLVDFFVLGLDGVVTGSMALPRTASLWDPLRAPYHSFDDMAWSTLPGGVLDESRVAFGGNYCDADTFGEVVLTGLIQEDEDRTSALFASTSAELEADGLTGAAVPMRGAGGLGVVCGDVTGDGLSDLVFVDVVSESVVILEGRTM